MVISLMLLLHWHNRNMGHLHDTTVEVTYNGKTTRVAKEDAHLYVDKKAKKESKPKEKE